MNIVIKKAEMIDQLFLKYGIVQSQGDVKNISNTKSDQPIHEDLVNAFRSVIPHFTYICEEVKDENWIEGAIERPESFFEDPENSVTDVFFKYLVNSVTFKGKLDGESVVIAGTKRLASGKTVTFAAPEIWLGDPHYKYTSELQEAIQTLKEEVLAYIEGKQAERPQMEMFATAGGDEFDDDTI
jgi:hypothetical protein